MMKSVFLLVTLLFCGVSLVAPMKVCAFISWECDMSPVFQAIAPCTADNTTATCVIDYTPFTRAQYLEATCNNISNATFTTVDVSRTCGALTFENRNIPYCFSPDCDEEGLQTAIAEDITVVFANMGIQCSVEASGAAYLKALTAVFAASVALASLFL